MTRSMVLAFSVIAACVFPLMGCFSASEEPDAGPGADHLAGDPPSGDDASGDDSLDNSQTFSLPGPQDADATAYEDDTGADDDIVVPDTEYDSPFCNLPDPEGLGGETLFGGGAATDTITVYVFSDKDCQPIQNAKVIRGAGDYLATTDQFGKATITTTGGIQLVTAYKTDFWGWSYQTDQSILYFRLRPSDYNINYTDSQPGTFYLDGAPLNLTNPQSLDEAYLMKAYAGILLPGFSRNTIFSADFPAMWPDSSFEVNYVYDFDGTDTLALPSNFFLPDLNVLFEIPDTAQWGFWGGNADLKISTASSRYGDQMPIGGFVFSLNISSVIDLPALMMLFEVIYDDGDIATAVQAFAKPLLNTGLAIEYVGMNPSWAISTPSDLEMKQASPVDGLLRARINSMNTNYDYLELAAAEIPNRDFVPLGMAAPDDGAPAFFSLPRFADADYLFMAMKTDMLRNDPYEPANIAVTARFAEDPVLWQDEIVLTDADFPPLFDSAATSFNLSTGEFSWEIDGDASSIDAFVVYYCPAYNWNSKFVTVLPGDARSLKLPMDQLGVDPYSWDSYFIIAVDMPDSYEAGFDPTRLFGYDNAAFTVWAYPDLLEAGLAMY